MLWNEYVMSLSVGREGSWLPVLGTLGCRGYVLDCVPNEMVLFEGDSSQDQLKCVSMGRKSYNNLVEYITDERCGV